MAVPTYALTLSAIGIYVHGVFVALVLTFPWLILTAEAWGARKRDREYYGIARNLAKAMAVFLGTGAALGTMVEFGLITVWPSFIKYAGLVLFYPFFIEMFAFAVEILFFLMYWFTWDRLVGTWSHIAMIAVTGFGAALSGYLIMIANSFMQNPTGVEATAAGLIVNHAAVFFNPAQNVSFAHTLFASFAAAAFTVAGVYGYKLLRGDVAARSSYLKAFRLAFLFGGVFLLAQVGAGDAQARLVAEYQPIKLAAIEGIQESGPQGFLSILTHGDPNAPMLGLNDVPAELRPPLIVAPLYLAKLGLTAYAIVAALLVGVPLVLRRPPSRWKVGLSMTLMVVVPLIAGLGWAVREIGRKPWTVYGLLKPEDIVAPTEAISPALVATFAAFLGVILAGVGLALYIVFVRKKE